MANNVNRVLRTGWASRLAALSLLVLAFETITGLAVTFGPFHPVVEWGVLLHTLVGALTLLPLLWYFAAHWLDYKHYSMSHVVLLGYVAVVALLVCMLSGLVVTLQGFFAIKTTEFRPVASGDELPDLGLHLF